MSAVLLLAMRSRRWDPLAHAALAFGGISVFCGFIGKLVTAYGIDVTDSAVVPVRVLDEGAIASLLAYAVVLAGVICAFAGTPPRTRA
jgi:drug/metabolite transporter (DMT)-like permease